MRKDEPSFGFRLTPPAKTVNMPKEKKKARTSELKFISGLLASILAILHKSHAFFLNGAHTRLINVS